MQKSSPDFFSNPTTRRLAWIRTLFFEQARRRGSIHKGIKPVDSREIIPKPGVFLVAPPMMHDPNFRRSVVLLCEHTPEGSFGLILNRPLGVHLAEVVRGIGEREMLIGQGGPVQTDTLHYIHTCGDLLPETVPVSNGVFWGGDFDIMKLLIETGQVSPEEVRFFLGYAGWSPGQLLDEIDQGGWIIAPGRAPSVFRSSPDDLWRSTLRTMGDEYAILSNFPEDPRLN